jgi:hypothetical protein
MTDAATPRPRMTALTRRRTAPGSTAPDHQYDTVLPGAPCSVIAAPATTVLAASAI